MDRCRRAGCTPATAGRSRCTAPTCGRGDQQRLAAAPCAGPRRADGRRRDVRRRPQPGRRHRRPARRRARPRPTGALDGSSTAAVDDYARPRRPRRRRHQPAVAVPAFGCLHPASCCAGSTAAARRTTRSPRSWLARLLRRRARPPAGSAWRSWNPAMADMALDSGAAPTSGSPPGATAGPATRSSTPACASCVAEGWMHNRVRMITAQLPRQGPPPRLDARRPALHATTSSTATSPSNNHGWQWVAGTGTDAAPYFRIFNPTAAGPSGSTPTATTSAAGSPSWPTLDDARVHEPRTAPDGPPPGYPAPIVDHATERASPCAATSPPLTRRVTSLRRLVARSCRGSGG